MSVATIRAAILAKLNAMQTPQRVYDHCPNEITESPGVVLEFAGAPEAKFASNQENLRIRAFDVGYWVDKSRVGFQPDLAEDIVTAGMDELETAFDMDTTLSGTCLYVRPITADASYIDREVDTRVLKVTLHAAELVTAT